MPVANLTSSKYKLSATRAYFISGLTLVVLGIVMGVYFLPQLTSVPSHQPTRLLTNNPTVPSVIIPPVPLLPPQALTQDVPFTKQAPFSEWSDPRQQNACEEAAVLIAGKWQNHATIASPQEAKTDILTLSHLAESMFGDYVDSSTADTLRLFQAYWHTTTGEVKYDITLDDIKTELAAGRIVIVPLNGRKLNNPYFTAGGPDRHMVVIIGYDDATGMFTTNDPGIGRGKDYQYPYQTLFAALRDFITGDHVPITITRSAMISISRS